jgi:hypothetical protein
VVIADRWRRRGAGILAVSALVAMVGAAGACSAGQHAQTADVVAAVPGAAWTSPDGSIALRDVVIAYGTMAGYPRGGSAPLVVRIFNAGTAPVSLTGVTADVGQIELVGAGSAAAASAVAASPDASTSPDASESPSASAGAGSPGAPGASQPSDGTEPTASPLVTGPAGNTSFTVAVPVSSYALLVPGAGPYLRLVNLVRPVTSGDTAPVQLTFTFSNGISATLSVRIAPPLSAGPRPSSAE